MKQSGGMDGKPIDAHVSVNGRGPKSLAILGGMSEAKVFRPYLLDAETVKTAARSALTNPKPNRLPPPSTSSRMASTKSSLGSFRKKITEISLIVLSLH